MCVFWFKIHEETGASVSTKGTWYPDRSKATDRDPPLYLHIAANTQEILQSAVAKVKELIDTELGSLVEDKKDRQRERVRCSSIGSGVKQLTRIAAQMARGEAPCWARVDTEL